jgi:hypothetical protein
MEDNKIENNNNKDDKTEDVKVEDNSEVSFL